MAVKGAAALELRRRHAVSVHLAQELGRVVLRNGDDNSRARAAISIGGVEQSEELSVSGDVWD